MKKIGICGIPSGLGCALPGTQKGPNKFRDVGLVSSLQAKDVLARDFGDIHLPPSAEIEKSQVNAKNLTQVTAYNAALKNQVSEILNQGLCPVVLGGDHSYAIGSIAAVARHCQKQGKKLKVIWFDAHADFNTPTTSPTGNIHGMPVKVLTGKGPESLRDLVAPHFVSESSFHLMGIRDVDPLEQVSVDQSQLNVCTMKAILEVGLEGFLNTIFSDVDENTHLHFSFDIDGIDPSLAPGVGTPVDQGFTQEQTQAIFSAIKASGCLGSMDVVELNPDQDDHDKTACLARDFVLSLF